MKKERVASLGSEPTLCYSPAVRYGDTLYVSGQVGEDECGCIPIGIEEQTKLAIQNAKKLIESAGGSLNQVLMCQCYIQKESDFLGMNTAYAEFFGGSHNIAPARYTVIAPPADRKYLVEISMIAGL